jgi:signal peptidase I
MARLLQSGRRVRFQARGRSMTPFILEGDILLVDPEHPAQRGSVAFVCSVDRGCLAHRVIHRYPDGRVILQGDHNWHSDGIFQPSDILGGVFAVERGERTLRLDRGAYRWLGLAWSYVQPLRRIMGKVARALLMQARNTIGNGT